MWMILRSYSRLIQIPTFTGRYDYLREHGEVGIDTFGHNRWLNQAFYRSREWRNVRQEVIARDRGCDLGFEGYEIVGAPYIHHMNPIRLQDVRGHEEAILDPEYLITVSLRTHNAIHYGTADQLPTVFVSRRAGDTKLW
jgi:hypothetical protein